MKKMDSIVEKGTIQVEGCCGCLNLKHGSIAISIWQILFAIAYYAIGYCLYTYFEYHADENWRYAFMTGYRLVAVLGILSGIVLLVGVVKQYLWCFKLTVFIILFILSVNINIIISENAYTKEITIRHMKTPADITIYFLEIYFCIVIGSTYDMIKQRKRYDRMIEEQREKFEREYRTMSINPFIDDEQRELLVH